MTSPESQTQFLDVPNPKVLGNIRQIAHQKTGKWTGHATRLLWLPGFLSDMASTKATALAAWAEKAGLPLMRFDYSGHGKSSGSAAEACIGDWLEESLAVFNLMGEGRCVIVGSSMGGWLALLLAKRLIAENRHHQLAGLVLIAPAWDMTEALMWRQLPDAAKAEIESVGIYHQPSEYGGTYPISKRLIEEGRSHLLQGAGFDPACPVRILQGMRDPDVPWRHSLALVELLKGDDVVLHLVKDGDHRLSRPQDLARFERVLEGVTEELP